MKKKHGQEKHQAWMNDSASFFCDDSTDPTGGTGVESAPTSTGGLPAFNLGLDTSGIGIGNDNTNLQPDGSNSGTAYTASTTPAASGGGLGADLKNQTSSVKGLLNLFTEGSQAITNLAGQVKTLQKAGTAAPKKTQKTNTTTPPLKIAGMSVPVLVGVGIGLLALIAAGFYFSAPGGSTTSTSAA